jgi:hypothetical protein
LGGVWVHKALIHVVMLALLARFSLSVACGLGSPPSGRNATMHGALHEEAIGMEFTISCPVDGMIDVSLEDVDTVVLRDNEHADITFVCPTCGAEIKVAAVVPSFLMAAIKALADNEEDVSKGAFAGMFDSSDTSECAIVRVPEDAVAEAYCEYFRRQLDEVFGADDILAEIDAYR